jgi:hypothetical protein
MNQHQKFLQRILEHKERKPKDLKYFGFMNLGNEVLLPLSDVLKAHHSDQDPISKFMAAQANVYLIAILHSTFREYLKKLINDDYEYVRKLSKRHDVKFELEYVAGIIGKKISLGDFVTHHFQPNSLEELSGIYNVLYQEGNFFRDLESHYNKLSMTKNNNRTFGQIVGFLKDTFKERHIACHEVNILGEYDITQLYDRIIAMMVLITFIEEKAHASKKRRIKRTTKHSASAV